MAKKNERFSIERPDVDTDSVIPEGTDGFELFTILLDPNVKEKMKQKGINFILNNLFYFFHTPNAYFTVKDLPTSWKSHDETSKRILDLFLEAKKEFLKDSTHHWQLPLLSFLKEIGFTNSEIISDMRDRSFTDRVQQQFNVASKKLKIGIIFPWAERQTDCFDLLNTLTHPDAKKAVKKYGVDFILVNVFGFLNNPSTEFFAGDYPSNWDSYNQSTKELYSSFRTVLAQMRNEKNEWQLSLLLFLLQAGFDKNEIRSSLRMHQLSKEIRVQFDIAARSLGMYDIFTGTY